MFSSKEEKCNMSDKGAVVSRHVVFTDDSEVVEFGFVSYENHPLCGEKMLNPPKFSELRTSDRVSARRNFSSEYQKIEFSTFCAKASENLGIDKTKDCINILTEKGIWWGTLRSTSAKTGRNINAMMDSANELIEKYEPDIEGSGNPFCVIYSGWGMMPDNKAMKNYKIIANEFGGEDNIPMDHPFIKRHLRVVCIAQARSSETNMMMLASIQQSDLVRFCKRDDFKNFLPASTFRLEPMTEKHESWKSTPHVNFKNLALVG
jgi:hypothetical protein